MSANWVRRNGLSVPLPCGRGSEKQGRVSEEQGRGSERRPERVRIVLSFAGLVLAAVQAGAATPAEDAAFDKNVMPLLTGTCSQCHNAGLASGGFNASVLESADSIAKNRETWSRVLRKLRAGEMPPPDVEAPPAAQVSGLVNYVQAQMDAADKNTKPDPGRVTAHRLNRNEYTNTIRDLLAVDFRADKDFPSDDSGGGFDNMSEVLTVSPVLMEKYLSAAEQIAARAIGADPLPKPIQVEYAYKDRRVRRIDASTIEATHRVDFDAEYDIRFALQGERAPAGAPVLMGFWMDGKLLKSMMVETKPSGLIYFDPYSGRRSTCTFRPATMCSARALSTTISSRGLRIAKSTTARRTSSWTRSCSRGRLHPRWRSRAARRF